MTTSLAAQVGGRPLAPTRWGCTERVSPRVLNKFRLQSDLLHARKRLGHRAVALGGLGLLQEKLLIDPRDFGLRAQIDPADRVPLPRAPEAHPSFGVDAFRGVALGRKPARLSRAAFYPVLREPWAADIH